MPELLLEVGVEELPATFVRKATSDLADHLKKSLTEAGILPEDAVITAMGTPRRLIVGISNVLDRQEDQVKEQRGPGLKAAYDAEGNPSQALLGFCRAQGGDPSQLRNDGQYVWLTKQIPGKASSELLSDLLPKAVRSLTFDKTMRWGAAKMRFARPIRWIVALLDAEVVPFDIEGVISGNESRGHRFYASETFRVSGLGQLMGELRQRHVEPDPEVRRRAIIEQATAIAPGTPQMSEALIDENVYLTEWPTAIAGTYRQEYQELPQPVLVTAMAKHEKMFPVRDGEGKLTNSFVFIRNSGEDETVRKGAEWVLNARFNDAKFFLDEDKKHTLKEFLEKTSGILFQDKLGTVRQRADRLSRLAEEIARQTGANEEETRFAREAGLYSKADLSTGLVSELASLQGVIGGEYAKREGFADAVCWALASQYDLSKNPEVKCEGARTAIRLLLADQLDKLAGYLGVGLAPSGSSDPFGLRRAATLIIEASWLWPGELPSFQGIFAGALESYEAQGVTLDRQGAMASLAEVFASRYEALLAEVRYDMLNAALGERGLQDVASPKAFRMKLRVLERLVDDVPFVQTATRPVNIVAAAKKKDIPVGETLSPEERVNLHSSDGEELLSVAIALEAPLREAMTAENDEEAARLLLTLAGPINRCFDSTMVMAEEPDVRYARLTLLQMVSRLLLQSGDWSKIVIEG
ncbi:MAG: glycine--tRNA ligase subunit beta [Fimbriimonas sp.]